MTELLQHACLPCEIVHLLSIKARKSKVVAPDGNAWKNRVPCFLPIYVSLLIIEVNELVFIDVYDVFYCLGQRGKSP